MSVISNGRQFQIIQNNTRFFAMENSVFAPQTSPLKNIATMFWQIDKQDLSAVRETVVPKGNIVVIFNIGDEKCNAKIGDNSVPVPQCFLQGYCSCPIQVYMAGRQTFFGVVLYPCAVKNIFRFCPAESLNSVIDLTLINRSFASLWLQISELKSFAARVNLVSEWLLTHFKGYDKREAAFNSFLYSNDSNYLSISQIAARFCMCNKHLSRQLREFTGMSAERTLLYKKYIHSLYLTHYSSMSLTEVAYACHFADQSHLTKTFKSLAWLTPKDYKRLKGDIVGHISEYVR